MSRSTFGEIAGTVIEDLTNQEDYLEYASYQRKHAVVIPDTDGSWKVSHHIVKDKLSSDKQEWVDWWVSINEAKSMQERVQAFHNGLEKLVAKENPLALRAKEDLLKHGFRDWNTNASFEKGQADFTPAAGKNPFFRG